MKLKDLKLESKFDLVLLCSQQSKQTCNDAAFEESWNFQEKKGFKMP